MMKIYYKTLVNLCGYQKTALNNCVLILWLLCLPGLQAQAEEKAEEKIIVWDRTYDQASMLEVLQLALDHTQADKQPYKIIRSLTMEQGRVLRELESSERIDLAAFAPTPERELQAIPIRIPVSKGLLGFRVCLIRAGQENAFSGIKSLDDWISQGLRIGQGSHWPDTPILEANGITVIKSVRYKPLFTMLEKQRFDCFSRSVNEISSELEGLQTNKFAIEKNLLFVYRLPTFFFVSKHKPELAKRIERGLHLALEDGSFKRLFEKLHGPTLTNLNLKQRKVIYLENPYLSDETRLISNKTELWLDSFD